MSTFEPTDTCLRLAASFSEVADGEAPHALVEEALEHTKSCPYCDAEFAKFKALIDQCREMKQPVPSEKCRQRLMSLFNEFKTERNG